MMNSDCASYWSFSPWARLGVPVGASRRQLQLGYSKKVAECNWRDWRDSYMPNSPEDNNTDESNRRRRLEVIQTLTRCRDMLLSSEIHLVFTHCGTNWPGAWKVAHDMLQKELDQSEEEMASKKIRKESLPTKRKEKDTATGINTTETIAIVDHPVMENHNATKKSRINPTDETVNMTQMLAIEFKPESRRDANKPLTTQTHSQVRKPTSEEPIRVDATSPAAATTTATDGSATTLIPEMARRVGRGGHMSYSYATPIASCGPEIAQTYEPVPGSAVRILGVFYQLIWKEDHVFGYMRATKKPDSLVVFTQSGYILNPSGLASVIRILKLPRGLQLKYRNESRLHLIRDVSIEDDETKQVQLVNITNEDEVHAVKVKDLTIPLESMRYIKSIKNAQIAKVVEMDRPWESLDLI